MTLVSGCRDGVRPGVGECDGDECAPSSAMPRFFLKLFIPMQGPSSCVTQSGLWAVGSGAKGVSRRGFLRRAFFFPRRFLRDEFAIVHDPLLVVHQLWNKVSEASAGFQKSGALPAEAYQRSHTLLSAGKCCFGGQCLLMGLNVKQVLFSFLVSLTLNIFFPLSLKGSLSGRPFVPRLACMHVAHFENCVDSCPRGVTCAKVRQFGSTAALTWV